MKLEQVEYNDLKELYKIDNVYSSYEKIGANVIGRNSDSWYDTFIIDKGSADGIEVDMNVIAGNGLVGIVYKVSEKYSHVRSIIDDESKVSSMLMNTSDVCAVSGDLKLIEDGYLRLRPELYCAYCRRRIRLLLKALTFRPSTQEQPEHPIPRLSTSKDRLMHPTLC